MSIILHITHQDQWELAQETGNYTAESLEAQGFIHCSTHEQVIEVANFLFKGQRGLVLLAIDREKVKHEVVYENLYGEDDLFPHIYGALNTDAVFEVYDFPPKNDGNFELPSALTVKNDLIEQDSAHQSTTVP